MFARVFLFKENTEEQDNTNQRFDKDEWNLVSETLESISFDELKNSKHSVMQKMINYFGILGIQVTHSHAWKAGTCVCGTHVRHVIQTAEYVLSGFFRLHSCLCLMFFQCLIEYIREGKYLITTIYKFFISSILAHWV